MVGTGIFATTGFLAGDLGSPSLVIGIWFVGAILAVIGALCYSELGINFPRSGGEYVYLREAFGPTWGFIDGCVSFLAGFSAPTAIAAIAIAAYLAHFDPALDPLNPQTVVDLGIVQLQLGGGQLVACGVIIALSLLNLLNVSKVGQFQNFFTAAKLVVLALFLVLGFSVGTGDWGNFSLVAERTSSSPIPIQFAVSLVFVYLGYSGWNAAVYVAEEIRDPRRTLPLALLGGTFLVTIFYALLNLLYIYATPLEEMKGVVAVGSQAADRLFGPSMAGMFSAAMAFSLLATVNAMCLIGPRVYYAMARDGAFLSAAARLHPKWKSPWVSVLMQGACCCLLIITGTFDALIYYIGFMLSLFTALSVLALYKFRRRADWQKTPAVSFAYPLLPVIYVATNIAIFCFFVTERVQEALFAALTVGVAALLYRMRTKTPAPATGRDS